MKKYFLVVVLTLLSTFSFAQEEEKENEVITTTYYFIRHAEKQRQNPNDKDPRLSFEGYKRADQWESVFKYIPLSAVYSTNYNRTKETAAPTAKSKGLPILVYDPSKMYSESFQYNTKGKHVLIVGHSNTTPAFVNKVLGENRYKSMDDTNNSSLYIVTVMDGNASVHVLNIELRE